MLCLEALLDDIDKRPGDLSLRTALYQMVHQLWGATVLAESSAGGGHVRPAPITRAALLLCAMEGFDTTEAARILGIEPAEVDELVAAAADDFYRQTPHEIMIVEDEAIIALDLKMIVEEIGHRVSHVARTEKEAVASGLEHMPELVLADVHLADGSSGIDAVRTLLQSADVPVIFVTAYPERLLTGDRPEPAFIVTKPFSPATIKAAVWQAIGTKPLGISKQGAGG
jgi:CheY-like chemotaxis protein